tara:strand:+ start:667587 stop:668144 length:558 start_codon:yes stop_codon:yes gene_type:complete
METTHLEGILKQFKYYKSLGDKTFDQLSDQELHWKHNDYSNNIAIIAKHLVGNMLSRWTHFLTEDGEKEWRQRDSEFVDTYHSKAELIDAWEKGWTCLFEAITPLTTTDLNSIIYIRNQGQSVADAIHRQLAHYAYHIGQIVYIGTLVKNNDWKSLSIPKNQSSNFNTEKFDKGKHQGHFTDDLL